MSLGRENQILLTRFAFDAARQVLKGQDLPGIGPLSWLNHGPYLLKGVEEPIEVCEAGEPGKAALTPPASSQNTQRFLPADAEPVLGWRPAVGQTVPGSNWSLQEKLGEGGFGEVWLGWHDILKERRVFKFCFRADRVRSLKREVTLFRLLKEKVGQHPNVMSIRGVYFDEPPYYIAMDYAGGKDLGSWCKGCGGVEKVPLEKRLEMVAQIAEGLSAAHAAGIIHRDIKPTNILVIDDPKDSSKFCAKLSDFGIGQVVSTEALQGLTRLGFTQTAMSSSSSHTGTLLYMAPELLAGKPATPQSDIYSLGVLLYQLVVGDLTRPVTMDWIRNIDDVLLQEDLARCFAGSANDRLASAEELAKSLRQIDDRNAKRQAELEKSEARKKRGYLGSLFGKAALVFLMLGVLASGYYFVRNFQAGKYGSIEIQTVPAGAEVWLKGLRVGTTPYRAALLTPGELTCSLKLIDYEPFETKLFVTARDQTRLMAFLTQVKPILAAVVAGVTNTAEVSRSNLTQIVAAAAVGVVVAKEGKVEFAKKNTKEWKSVELNLVLSVGDHMRTGVRSSVSVRLGDGTVMRISELTSMQMQPPKGSWAHAIAGPGPGQINEVRLSPSRGSR